MKLRGIAMIGIAILVIACGSSSRGTRDSKYPISSSSNIVAAGGRYLRRALLLVLRRRRTITAAS